jgi:DNA-binding CsgD family transcriptional regulator/PAS domain-containing protein
MTSESHVSELIELIYEAADQTDRWPDFLNRLADSCGSDGAGLNFYASNHAERWGINPRTDPAYEQSYVQYYAARDLTSRANLRLQPGVVDTNNLWEIAPDIRCTEFYNDWMKPQGINAGAHILAGHTMGGALVLSLRNSRALELRHATLLRRLAPHVVRAVELNVRLARAEADRIVSLNILDRLEQGVFLVDAKGEILFANQTAEGLLRGEQGLLGRGRVLSAGTPAETGAMRALIEGCARSGAEAGSGGTVVVSRGLDRTPLSLVVIPTRGIVAHLHNRCPAAVIFVTDPDRTAGPSRDYLRALFKLTPTEAALAVELVEGDGLQSAATRLGIKRETARTHLQHIFEKTGTRRQAELARLLVGLSGGLRQG